MGQGHYFHEFNGFHDQSWYSTWATGGRRLTKRGAFFYSAVSR